MLAELGLGRRVVTGNDKQPGLYYPYPTTGLRQQHRQALGWTLQRWRSREPEPTHAGTLG